MNNMLAIFKRELRAYFSTPVAYVFIVIFLFLTGIFTFYIGNFYETNQADLSPFFSFHPWLYLFLIPSISMRLWSEERKTGTIELLMTLARFVIRSRDWKVSGRLVFYCDRIGVNFSRSGLLLII